MTIRTPVADLAVPPGAPRLHARKIPRSDLSEGPNCASQGHFRGGRSRAAGRSPPLRRRSRPASQVADGQYLGTAASVSRRPRNGLPACTVSVSLRHFPRNSERPSPGRRDNRLLRGEEIVKALQTYVVLAFNHALARDRAVDPRHNLRVRLRSRQSRPESIPTFRQCLRDNASGNTPGRILIPGEGFGTVALRRPGRSNGDRSSGRAGVFVPRLVRRP